MFFISVSYCPINTKQYEQPQTNFYLLILYYTAYEICLMQSEGISSVVILHLQARSLVKGCTIAARITAVYLHNDIMWENHNFLIWAVWRGISDGTKVNLLQLEFDLWLQKLIFIRQCSFSTVRKYGSSDKTLWSWHMKTCGYILILPVFPGAWDFIFLVQTNGTRYNKKKTSYFSDIYDRIYQGIQRRCLKNIY